MAHVRRVLPRLAAAWLFCQAATLTLAPATYWLGSAEKLLECKCTHGDHGICPMRHKPAPGSKICLMRSANDSTPAVLTSLFAGAGPLPANPTPFRSESPQAIVVTEITTRSVRPPPPDPPPPRA